MCIGAQPNTELIRASGFPDWLDTKSYIQVDNKLQVKICDMMNIYAIGDCCDVPEEKMARVVEAHAKTVAYNIDQFIHKRHDMRQYEGANARMIMLVTVGRRMAIM